MKYSIPSAMTFVINIFRMYNWRSQSDTAPNREDDAEGKERGSLCTLFSNTIHVVLKRDSIAGHGQECDKGSLSPIW
jgi:hypothetical protein